MPKLLFRLANVPEQEIEEVCHVLEQNDIDFYHTEEGRWKLGVNAIWVRDEQTYARARDLINTYQRTLQQGIVDKIENNQYQPLGFIQGLYYGFKQRPAAMLITLISVMIVLLFVLLPFFSVF